MNQLFAFLSTFGIISDSLQTRIIASLIPTEFRKGQFLTQEGLIDTHLHFIDQGLVYAFFTDKKAKEKVTLLLKEGQLIAFAESYYTRTPSFYNVKALEDCLTYRISYADLDGICIEYLEFWQIRCKMTQFYNFMLSHKIRDMKVGTAEERYAELLLNSPELIQRVPIKLLASYLNTTQFHFSRVRNRIDKITKENLPES